MATEIDTLTVSLKADVASFQKAMTGAIGGVTKSLGKIGIAAAAASLALAGVGAAAGAIANATGKAADFEQSIVNAASKTDDFAASQAAFAEAAIKSGLATAFSAQQAADALDILATAGFGTIEATGALPGVLQLAQAGMLSLSDAADVTATAMKGYGFEASELGRVNDVLVSGFTGANQTASELGQALRKAGPLAKTVGQEFSTTVAVLSKLADAGFKAEEGGTALKVAMARLAEPTTAVKARLKDLGVEVRASGGKLRDMIDIVADLSRAQANAGDLAVIFGQRSGPTLASLLVQGEDALRKFKKRLDESGGAAAELERRQLATLGSQFKILEGTVETAAISFGSVLGPAIKPVVSSLQRMMQRSLESGEALKSLRSIVIAATDVSITMLDVIEALAPAFFAMAGAVRFSANIIQIMQKIVVQVGRSLVGFATLAIGGIVRAAGDLIQIIGEAGNAVGADFGPKLTAAGDKVSSFSREMAKLGADFVSTEDAVKGIAGDMSDMEKAFKNVSSNTEMTVSKVSELRGALQSGRKAVLDVTDGAFLGSVAMQKFGDATKDAGNKFRDFKKDVEATAFDKLLSMKPPKLGPLLNSLAKEFGDFTDNLDAERQRSLEALNAIGDIDREIMATLQEGLAFDRIIAAQIDAAAAADKAINELNANVLSGMAGLGKGLGAALVGNDKLFKAMEGVVAGAVEGFAAGGPGGALAGALVPLGEAMLGFVTETRSFQRLVSTVNAALQPIGRSLGKAAGAFAEALKPLATLFVGLLEAIGPLVEVLAVPALKIGFKVLGTVLKGFAIVLSTFAQGALFILKGILQVPRFLFRLLASVLNALDEFGLVPDSLRRSVNRAAKGFDRAVKGIDQASDALGKARDSLLGLRDESRKVVIRTARQGTREDLARRQRRIRERLGRDRLARRTTNLSKSMDKLNSEIQESLVNVPTGIKLALARFRATTGAGAPFGAGATPIGFAGPVGAGVVIQFNAPVTVISSTPEEFIEKSKNLATIERFNTSGRVPSDVLLLGRGLGR